MIDLIPGKIFAYANNSSKYRYYGYFYQVIKYNPTPNSQLIDKYGYNVPLTLALHQCNDISKSIDNYDYSLSFNNQRNINVRNSFTLYEYDLFEVNTEWYNGLVNNFANNFNNLTKCLKEKKDLYLISPDKIGIVINNGSPYVFYQVSFSDLLSKTRNKSRLKRYWSKEYTNTLKLTEKKLIEIVNTAEDELKNILKFIEHNNAISNSASNQKTNV